MSELGGVRTRADDGEVGGGHESTGGSLGRHLEELGLNLGGISR